MKIRMCHEMRSVMKKLILISLLCLFSSGFAFADPVGDALIRAAQTMDESLLRQALRSGANVNYRSNERTALMEACNNQWLNGVRILLEEGKANPSYPNAYQQTALMFAAKTNDNTDIARLLIDRNANVNVRDTSGNTVLMYAAENQNDIMIDFIIRSGANTGATNIYDQDALIIAAQNNNYYAVRRLLQSPGINWSQAGTDGYTAFMWACERQATDMIAAFVEKGFDVVRANDRNGLPPLLWLIQFKKSYTVIEYLLRNTGAIASRDRNGRDALWYLNNYDRDNTRLRRLLEEANR